MRINKYLLIACTIMAFSGKAEEQKVPNYDKSTVFFFNNRTDEKVHALLIRPDSFSKVLQAGGWTQKSFDQLVVIGRKITPLVAKALGAGSAVKIIDIFTGLIIDAIGDLPAVAGGGIALSTIKKKDYLRQIFPRSINYSYDPTIPKKSHSTSAIESDFRQNKYPYELIVVVFKDKDGIPNLKEPLYMGPFNRRKFNAVQFGPTTGEAIYFKIEENGTIAQTKDLGVFAPVELDGGDVNLTDAGKSLIEGLLEKFNPKNDEEKEEKKEAEKLLND